MESQKSLQNEISRPKMGSSDSLPLNFKREPKSATSKKRKPFTNMPKNVNFLENPESYLVILEWYYKLNPGSKA